MIIKMSTGWLKPLLKCVLLFVVDIVVAFGLFMLINGTPLIFVFALIPGIGILITEGVFIWVVVFGLGSLLNRKLKLSNREYVVIQGLFTILYLLASYYLYIFIQNLVL